MDKILLTNHIKDIDLKQKMYKVIDKANSSLKNYDLKYTEFLNPYEVKNAVSILNAMDDLNYSVDGGYEQSERKLIYIYPFYMTEDTITKNIRVLKISGNFKFSNISHKDYLGSILGLGIKREKIGDILIHENHCQVIVSDDICDFILMNLTKIARNNVLVEEIKRDEIIYSKPNYKEVSFTISSSRLDCIISGIYNLSRQESLQYIKAERVFVNYEKIISSSRTINSGDIISVRGKGRCIVSEIGDLTKKGRIKIKVNIII